MWGAPLEGAGSPERRNPVACGAEARRRGACPTVPPMVAGRTIPARIVGGYLRRTWPLPAAGSLRGAARRGACPRTHAFLRATCAGTARARVGLSCPPVCDCLPRPRGEGRCGAPVGIGTPAVNPPRVRAALGPGLDDTRVAAFMGSGRRETRRRGRKWFPIRARGGDGIDRGGTANRRIVWRKSMGGGGMLIEFSAGPQDVVRIGRFDASGANFEKKCDSLFAFRRKSVKGTAGACSRARKSTRRSKIRQE